MAAAQATAESNRGLLDRAGVLAVNMMASPGAGKTTLIVETARRLSPSVRCAVVEGDVAGDLDARAVEEAGFSAVQINTGGGCHLRADMLAAALAEVDLNAVDVLFIENVGNLICPAGVPLGEHLRVVVSSTAEGDDKPVKYPTVFRNADAVVVSKWDIAPYISFDLERYTDAVRRLNGEVPVFTLSARTGEGVEAWIDWLRARADGARGA